MESSLVSLLHPTGLGVEVHLWALDLNPESSLHYQCVLILVN